MDTSSTPHQTATTGRVRRGRLVFGRPCEDLLAALACSQAGYFTLEQAGHHGFSKALVHARRSTFVRIERGIYRFRRWPDAECERHAVTWLWAKRLGMDAVFSHETALRLYGLWPMTTSPTETLRLTLPLTCSLRRLRRPWGVQLSFERLGPSERTCVGSIPVVRVGVALDQLCREGADMESMSEAYARGRARGLVSAREVALAHLLESHLAQRRGSEHAPLHRGTRSAIQDAVQAVG
ncbi:MAG: type IV toxin-antitoxin system AbiEi family antitoxin domain-containing protein [Myxococcales bacterium]|nr:type IV toxin-antitoxin system AbiEi family antitoxin domain-containing protein [Myxococcales bacterium]